MSADRQDFFDHFPEKISKALSNYVTNTVLKSSRYLFVWTEGKQQYGYCTHCGKEFVVGVKGHYLKHNAETKCQNTKCKSSVIVKSHGRGRRSLQDNAYLVWYEKSRVNPSAIIARCLYVERDYSGEYREVETEYRAVAMYLFEPIQGKKPGRAIQMSLEDGLWRERRKISSEFTRRACYWGWQFKDFFVAYKSIENAVKGTPFQYSTWQEFKNEDFDLVRFFKLAAKHPCVEYLSKLGLQSLICSKLRNQNVQAVKWDGKTIEEVLRITRQEIKSMLSAKTEITPETLLTYQTLNRKGVPTTFDQAATFNRIIGDSYYSDIFKKLLPKEPFEKKIKYLHKQLKREDGAYNSISFAVTDWRDYLKECVILGMDLDRDHVKYPNNLHAAHKKTAEKVKLITDERLNETLNGLIAKRLRELEVKYFFECGVFFIRPAVSVEELFYEGKELQHCVGGYSQDYALGNKDLLLIRKKEEPDTPFYTMEIQGGKIIQCRGFDNKNKIMTKEVDAFVEAFKSAKLAQKSKKKLKPKNQIIELEVAV